MINIDKIKDPYSAIAIIQWIKSNKQLFKTEDYKLKDIIEEVVRGNIDNLKVSDEEIKTIAYQWLNAHKDELRGKSVKGEDGVSIIDAKIDKDYLVITFSNDEEKRIKLPKQKVLVGGGGTIEDRTDLIITATQNTYLSAQSQTILCDATNENINIKLPRPSSCFNSGRSFRIVFTRKDITENIVTITPFGTELILNELSQDLLSREVINLITDGINWYYAA